MNRDKKAKDPRRNKIFAEAFDYLKRNQGIKNQQDLAKRMGVSADTVSRILNAYTDVKEDTITKLQTASGCVFNLQWLRGESDVMLAADVKNESQGQTSDSPSPQSQSVTPQGSADIAIVVKALEKAHAAEVAAKDETIASLKRELKGREADIRVRDERIAVLEQQVVKLAAMASQSEKRHSTAGRSPSGSADEVSDQQRI